MVIKEKDSSEEKKDFTVRIGPLLKNVLDLQKEKISEVTYGVVNASDFSAGEIIAKKIKGEI